MFAMAANAGTTIYYSPTCPHCHNALSFFESENIPVEKINVTEAQNQDAFRAALAKCEYESGGVPVIVIGEKCWQGYAEFMNDELRTAVAGDDTPTATTSTDEQGGSIWFWGILAVLVVGLGALLMRKKK